MDWRNRDSDYSSVDDLNLEEKRLLAKARSDASIFNLGGCDVCFEEPDELDFCDEDSTDFALALDRLRLSGSENSNERMITPYNDRGTQTCACSDCIEGDLATTDEIKSREISSMRLIVQGPEILNYQGIQYTPDDIARYWKKDSRMWLWKSVRLARRRMNESAKTSPINCTPNNQQNGLE